jgi:hypothetical protein
MKNKKEDWDLVEPPVVKDMVFEMLSDGCPGKRSYHNMEQIYCQLNGKMCLPKNCIPYHWRV